MLAHPRLRLRIAGERGKTVHGQIDMCGANLEFSGIEQRQGLVEQGQRILHGFRWLDFSSHRVLRRRCFRNGVSPYFRLAYQKSRAREDNRY